MSDFLDQQTQLAAEDVLEAAIFWLTKPDATDGQRDRNATKAVLRRALQQIRVSQTAHGFSVWDCVRHDGTSYVEALATTTANAVVLGVVAAVPDVDTFVLQLAGDVTGLSGLTAGSVHYLQDAGGLGTTPGTVSVPILLATSSTAGIILSVEQNATTAGGGTGDMLKSTYDTDDDGKVDKAERLEENVTTIAASGTSQTLDLSAGSIFDITLTGNCTISFSNVPSGGFGVTFVFTQDGTGSRTVTWPASFKWPGGTAPTLTTTAAGEDVITAFTPDGGTTWYGFEAGLAFS